MDKTDLTTETTTEENLEEKERQSLLFKEMRNNLNAEVEKLKETDPEIQDISDFFRLAKKRGEDERRRQIVEKLKKDENVMWVTVKEYAEALNCSEATVLRHIKNNELYYTTIKTKSGKNKFLIAITHEAVKHLVKRERERANKDTEITIIVDILTALDLKLKNIIQPRGTISEFTKLKVRIKPNDLIKMLKKSLSCEVIEDQPSENNDMWKIKLTGYLSSNPPPEGLNNPPPGGLNNPPPGGLNNPPPGGLNNPPPGGLNNPPHGGLNNPPPGGLNNPPPGGLNNPPHGGLNNPPHGGLSNLHMLD